MERNFKRISDGLSLSQESRERIRSQLASCQKQSEVIPMKKSVLKSRVPLIAAAAVMTTALVLTAGAAVIKYVFRNDIIVSSEEDIPDPSSGDGSPDTIGICGPIGNPPAPLEEVAQERRFKSEDWDKGECIAGSAGAPGYQTWDSVTVLSNDPALRIRQVGRDDGAKKMEYTAEDPANLADVMTHVSFDLSWLDAEYDYVPDANLAYAITDKRGNYVGEQFEALYAKKDGGGYFTVTVENIEQADYFPQAYVIEGSYETAYYYTAAGGYEFLIEMHNGMVWANCNTSHTRVGLWGAYLTEDEVEDILDHLALVIDK